MKIQEIEIQGFRNLQSIHLFPHQGFNGFWGPNGEGKTNFLEALYACLRGKSFRIYANKADWVPEDKLCIGSRVILKLEDDRGYLLECELKRPSEGRWEASLNGKRCRPAQIRERIPVVVFSPDDHAIIRRNPEVRRDFLDEMLTDICPGYAELLSRFERTLKSRNEVLKREAEGAEKADELKAWTHLLAQASAELEQLRVDIWPSFEKRFLATLVDLFEGALNFSLIYAADLALAEGEKRYRAEHFLKIFEDSYLTDLATGWTHRGPQRDDFRILMPDGGEARTKASQGQARLLALALRWTHADWVKSERREPPLFFIDDFSSELDAGRRKQLLTLISQRSGQLFVSGTERSLVDSESFSEYNNYTVKTGIFTPS